MARPLLLNSQTSAIEFLSLSIEFTAMPPNLKQHHIVSSKFLPFSNSKKLEILYPQDIYCLNCPSYLVVIAVCPSAHPQTPPHKCSPSLRLFPPPSCPYTDSYLAQTHLMAFGMNCSGSRQTVRHRGRKLYYTLCFLSKSYLNLFFISKSFLTIK